MKYRPFKELTDRFLSRVKVITDRRRNTPEPEEFKRLAKEVLDTLHTHLTSGGSLEDIRNLKDKPGNTRWVDDYHRLLSKYTGLYKSYSEIQNSEKTIIRIELKAQVMALAFRLLTTLGIGFGIMFIYWVAECWGVQLPLMRIPL